MRVLRATLAAMVCLSSACSEGGGAYVPGGRSGDLGKGSFRYVCVDSTDPHCPSGGTPNGGGASEQFPGAVAVGGRFALTYTPTDTALVGNPRLTPVSAETLAGNNTSGFTALRPGIGGVMVSASTSGEVVDFIALDLARVAKLSIFEGSSPAPSPLTLAQAATRVLRVRAQGSRDEPLSGAVAYTWSSSDPAVLHLDNGNPISEMHVSGGTAGTATLTVEHDAVQATLVVTVTP